jgi:hypothetical protein
MGLPLLVTAAPVLASPPANDNFASADFVSSLPFSESGDLAATTAEPGEPSSACRPSPAQTAWYVFTPSTSGHVKVDLAGSDFPVTVVAYQSSGGGFGGLSFVGCTGASLGSQPLVLAVTAGSTYYLQAGLFVPGPSHLQLHLDAVTPPPNDDFLNAAPLAGVPISATVDLTAATVETGEPSPAGGITSSAWYSYTPATSGTLLVQTNPNPSTVLAVYSGSSLAGLTPLASGPGYFPPLYFSAQAAPPTTSRSP